MLWEGEMLGDKDVVATVAVKDLQVARKFYQGTLGLELVHEEGGEAVTLKAGGARLIVYRSQFAGANRATAATWMVGGEIDRLVQGLKERGVVFEHYDMPGATQKGDVYAFGDIKSAWFKDPDGNIVALVNR
jgi:catechol 2,3-dioxygenase-like lactoylglutathione lyase family enzyme